MPPFSTNLAEEGVLIEQLQAGRRRPAAVRSSWRRIALSGPYPTRASTTTWPTSPPKSPPTIRAPRPAPAGRALLAGRRGRPTCGTSSARPSRRCGPRWRGCPRGRYRFVDHLDDGTPIAVTITIAGDRATIDFTGTGPVLPGNLNANRAIVTAAVMYCLRCLIDEDIPLEPGRAGPGPASCCPSAC